tara:strand:- start:2068 stop:2523 length:456 start_codon:yes stop_codon:yes gene_type:complete
MAIYKGKLTEAQKMEKHCEVAYMPPGLPVAALELDPNFTGGYCDNIQTGNRYGTPRFAQPGDFTYNPGYDDDGNLIDYTPPTNQAVFDKWKELLAAYDAKYYQLERQYKYGAVGIGEQLDKLYHDIDEGKLDKTGEFYTALKAVKDAHPKS